MGSAIDFSKKLTNKERMQIPRQPMPEQDPEGKGLLAMQRAFLNTGSPAVISTLWLRDDKAAAHFMELFYRQLDRKVSFADALRAAQIHLLREGQPPYVWAAFVLTGGY